MLIQRLTAALFASVTCSSVRNNATLRYTLLPTSTMMNIRMFELLRTALMAQRLEVSLFLS